MTYSQKQGKYFHLWMVLENLKSQTCGRNFQDFQENSLSSMFVR